MVVYIIITLAVGIFIGIVIDKITTGNCKLMKKFKESGESDLYKYVMENEGDKSESEDKNKE